MVVVAEVSLAEFCSTGVVETSEVAVLCEFSFDSLVCVAVVADSA